MLNDGPTLETQTMMHAVGYNSSQSKPQSEWERVDGVQVLRKDIDLGAEDKYGHWWTEMDGNESYGWWPKDPVDSKGTLLGVDGELNGQSSFGGTPTVDPHHGDRSSSVNVFDVYARSGTPAADVRSGIRAFANS